jgi:hypothetical protein
MAPPEKERRPGGGGAQDGHGGGNVTLTVPPRRCKFLHPAHLTGCRRPAEPRSDYCAQHRDGAS